MVRKESPFGLVQPWGPRWGHGAFLQHSERLVPWKSEGPSWSMRPRWRRASPCWKTVNYVSCSSSAPTRPARWGMSTKGRVAKLLPGMQSAFVNIGGVKDGFLYLDDPAAPRPGGPLLRGRGRGGGHRGLPLRPPAAALEGRRGDPGPGGEGSHRLQGSQAFAAPELPRPVPGAHARHRAHGHLPQDHGSRRTGPPARADPEPRPARRGLHRPYRRHRRKGRGPGGGRGLPPQIVGGDPGQGRHRARPRDGLAGSAAAPENHARHLPRGGLHVLGGR